MCDIQTPVTVRSLYCAMYIRHPDGGKTFEKFNILAAILQLTNSKDMQFI